MERSGSEKSQRIADAAVAIIFLLVIGLPLADMFLGLDRSENTGEKRRLVPFPQITLEPSSLKAFPAGFRLYLEDHFGFRNTLVRWHALLKTCALGVSSSDKVVLGKDGWLYYADHSVIDDYRCTRPFSQAELDQWLRVIEARREWLENRGIRFVMVFAPNKHTIYPEHLPGYINRVRHQSRLDQLLGHLREHSTATVVDVRAALNEHKPMRRLYHRTDTHWNEIGGFVADCEIAKVLSRWYEQVRPLPLSDYEIVVTDQPGMDLAGMLGGIGDVWREREKVYLSAINPTGATVPVDEREEKKIVTTRSDPRLPRGIVFCDSFIEAVLPFLAEHFQEVYFMRQEELDLRLIQEMQPDVVIYEMVERLLMRTPPEVVIPQ